MGKYVRVVEFKTEFEGEQVRLTMNPLNREAYMRLTRPMIDITSEKYGAAQPRILEQERTKLAMEVMTEHLFGVEGLTDAAGVALSKDDIIGKTYFMGLLGDAFDVLLEAAGVKKATSAGSEAK